ncbi:MAG TPA: pyridoxal kinase PdxY [Acetobacteraceae bacterium]|nr:pyridoxal kinase PdxY [Acetobacteraceae bacterium]
MPEPVNILSLQSWVAFGHVGNAAAVFPLQRLGAEVWAVHTVQFSNHTGYGDWTGEVFGAATIAALVEGIARRGVFPACDAVLSGYLGGGPIGEAVLASVGRAKAANPRSLYCCDPVIGDSGRGIYVAAEIPEFLRSRALPAADVALPNPFELSLLTGLPCGTLAETKNAVARLHAMGPRTVLVSGLKTEVTPADALDLLVGEGGAFHLLRTPLVPISVNGAGDVLAALFLFHLLASGSAVRALEAASSSLFGLIRRTAESGARELAIIAAQEEFVRPTAFFKAVAC